MSGEDLTVDNAA